MQPEIRSLLGWVRGPVLSLNAYPSKTKYSPDKHNIIISKCFHKLHGTLGKNAFHDTKIEGTQKRRKYIVDTNTKRSVY